MCAYVRICMCVCVCMLKNLIYMKEKKLKYSSSFHSTCILNEDSKVKVKFRLKEENLKIQMTSYFEVLNN